tara:strand:+ start:9388 stop:9906 length:519 start_codon:yes stop_codon:yes gene_type:complete
MELDDLEINTPMGWDEEDNQEQNGKCVLCEYADDAGSAMQYLKQLDTALGGRTSDGQLGKMMEESYNTYFADPMRKRNIEVPDISASEMIQHFTDHDINPLRVLRRDINNLQCIQNSLRPRMRNGAGAVLCNDSDARQWAHLERLKMDLVRQFEQTNARTSRDMPVVPDLPD